MPAFGRLALLLLLAPACFRDVAPPELSATSSETGELGQTSTGDQASTSSALITSSTGSTSSTSTSESTGPGSTSTSTTSSESTGTSTTGCTPTSWYLDADMDGHGDPAVMQLACDQPKGYVEPGDDCNDKDKTRAPGLVEVCDGKDNDCDELVDEYSMMNKSCNDCVLTASATSSYAYCTFQRTYMDARIECQKRGGDLAVIQDKDENQILTTQSILSGGGTSRWFIGFDDLILEGTFIWIDGSPLGYINWADGEPNNSDGVEDCGALYASDSRWNDQQCSIATNFICESALSP